MMIWQKLHMNQKICYKGLGLTIGNLIPTQDGDEEPVSEAEVMPVVGEIREEPQILDLSLHREILQPVRDLASC
ncbi:hypothetical protein U1Q18_032214 [Sarracenia purpurea var. burkii]